MQDTMKRATITKRDKLGRIVKGGSHTLKVDKIEIVCQKCKKRFLRLECKTKNNFEFFCSRKCYWENKKNKEIKWLKNNKEVAKKISKSLTGKKQPNNSNELHHEWKGEKAGYFAFHAWIKRKYGKAKKCENPNCKYPRKNALGKIIKKPKRFEWALIHGKKHDHKVENYWQLCKSCHVRYDMGQEI